MVRIDITQLQCELQTAQADFTTWASELMGCLDKLESNQSATLQKGAEEIRRLREEKDALQDRAETLSKKNSEEDQRIESLHKEVDALQGEESQLPHGLASMRAEVERIANALKREQQAAKAWNTSHDSDLATLQKLLDVNRRQLGLQFKHLKGDGTLLVLLDDIDAAQPSREFSFTVKILEDGTYSVFDFQPSSLEDKAQIDALNRSNDFSLFVRNFRRACKAMAAERQS